MMQRLALAQDSFATETLSYPVKVLIDADSVDPDHPFRSIAITDSGDSDHATRLA